MRLGALQKQDWRLIFACWALLAVVLVAYAGQQAAIAPLLADSDDAMRMTTATDLLEGQDWQDPVAHRDNAPFGSSLHWSRLVDAPIAALIALFRPLADKAAPDVAAITWPILLLLPLLALSVALCRTMRPQGDITPALALPVLSLVLMIEFLPGRVDHHNVQILLTLGLLLGVLQSRVSAAAGGIAGLLAATSIAIGIETLPFVVLSVAVIALYWAAAPGRYGAALYWFAAGFSGGVTAHFLLATAPERYWMPSCDALSITYVAGAALSSVALVLGGLAGRRLRSFSARAGLVAALCALAAMGTVVLFPSCLAGPYGGVNPAVLALQFPTISEAEPFASRLLEAPAVAIGFGLAPLLAMPVVAWRVWAESGETRIRWLTLLAFLAVAVLLMMIQIRGARLAVAFAIPAGAALIEHVRAAYLKRGGWRTGLMLVCSWLAFAGLFQFTAISAGSGWLAGSARAADTATSAQATPVPESACFMPASFEALAALPAGNLVAPLRLGAHILRYTHHAVVSAGFHRNADGILDTLAFFGTDRQKARAIAQRRELRYVVLCRGMPDEWKGEPVPTPAGEGGWPWLTPLSTPSETLQIFRIAFPSP